MTPTDYALLGAVVALWGVAAFLALSETSLTSISRAKALALADEGRRGAGHLLRLVEHPESFLGPLLLMVLLCHLVAATLIGVAFDDLGSRVLTAATIGQVVIVFVFAESAPKTWAIQHAERASLIAAPVVGTLIAFAPLRLLARALIVLTNVILPGKGLKQGPFVSEEELLALADVAAEEEVIEGEERTLIRSIIEFGDTVVREVMVPRPDMLALEGRGLVGDVLEIAGEAGYSRIPVFEQGIDDIVGVVYTRDILKAASAGLLGTPVRELVKPAAFVPEMKRVSELMREMQQGRFHLAIVVDEYGGTAGLVTLEDLIEELIGEIFDESDRREALPEELPGGGVRVNARMPVDEVGELLGAKLPDGDWDTIGGLLFNLLGHVPSEGEAVEHEGFVFAAEQVQGRRIGRVRIEPHAADDRAAASL